MKVQVLVLAFAIIGFCFVDASEEIGEAEQAEFEQVYGEQQQESSGQDEGGDNQAEPRLNYAIRKPGQARSQFGEERVLTFKSEDDHILNMEDKGITKPTAGVIFENNPSLTPTDGLYSCVMGAENRLACMPATSTRTKPASAARVLGNVHARRPQNARRQRSLINEDEEEDEE